MAFGPLTWLVVALAFIFYQVILSYRSYKRLAHFDGPRYAPYSRLWMLRNKLSGRQDAGWADVCYKYGPISRVGPNHLLTSDHNVMLHINGVRSGWTRSDWYRAGRFGAKTDNVVSERDDKIHNILRSQMASGYSGKENPEVEQNIDDRVADAVDLIQRKYLSSSNCLRVLDFCNLATYFTLDVISDIAFGEPFGCLAKDADVLHYMATFENFGPMILFGTLYPTCMWFMEQPWITALVGAPRPTDKTGLGRVLGVAQEVVSKRFQSDKVEHMDMLGSFIRHGLKQEQAQTEAALQIIAGADTTASAIRGTMLHVIGNPSVYASLVSEISTASRSGLISSPIRDWEAQKLPYLQAVIREGLRIFPPLANYQPKVAPPGGDIIHGKHVPGGTEVGFAMQAIQRQKHVFGNDADVFRPERWLEAGPDARSEMEKAQMMVFNSGKWSCLGKNVAFMELNKIFVEILRRFDVALADPTRAWSSINYGFTINKGMFVRITKRKEVF